MSILENPKSIPLFSEVLLKQSIGVGLYYPRDCLVGWLFMELAVDIKVSVSLFCDSKSTIQIAANPVFHECKKHINIDCHFICEKVQQGLVNILYLASSKQLANVFTTSLTIYQHNYLVSKLGMKNVFISPSLGGRGGYKGYCMY